MFLLVRVYQHAPGVFLPLPNLGGLIQDNQEMNAADPIQSYDLRQLLSHPFVRFAPVQRALVPPAALV